MRYPPLTVTAAKCSAGQGGTGLYTASDPLTSPSQVSLMESDDPEDHSIPNPVEEAPESEEEAHRENWQMGGGTG